MTDHTQLRKLATDALLDHEIRHSFTIDHSGWSGAGDLIEAQNFIAAANPQAVIELLDEIERLKKDAERVDYVAETGGNKVARIGKDWYACNDYGELMQKCASFRDAIDVAIEGDAAIDAAISKMESTGIK